MSEGLGLQRPAIGVISIAAAFLSAVALNHQSAEDIFAYSQDSNSNHNKVNSIIYYDIFSDLSRNFTGTVDKLEHNNNNNNNNNNNFQQDSGNTRH
jgi:hypothetical protein